MVCFRYIILNTLHKGDNKYDDYDDDDDTHLVKYTPKIFTGSKSTFICLLSRIIHGIYRKLF